VIVVCGVGADERRVISDNTRCEHEDRPGDYAGMMFEPSLRHWELSLSPDFSIVLSVGSELCNFLGKN
jgi:hypothetical protein